MSRDEDWFHFSIGVALAAVSSLFNGSSFILKKKALLKLSVRAGEFVQYVLSSFCT